ncbi:PAS domain S-box protein [Cesiribacter sp. SM1]|uniref:GAF domain-containing sensor histidine kinase n=1 Tax=Cesiribacter sp. SM1 TaxID=2861196 RepID=UPI001CD2A17A|nr:PAS domain S-box protein [Cesiribacter sp. SM1]
MDTPSSKTPPIDKRLKLLSDLTVAVNLNNTLEGKLQIITEKVREIIGCHQSITSMTNNENLGQAINAVSLSDKYAKWRDYNNQTDGSGIYSLICKFNKPMRLTQEALETHPAWKGFGKDSTVHPPMRGWLAAPLVDKSGKNLGLIQLSDKYEGEFSQEDELILVQLSQIASIAIENSQLLLKLQEALEEKDKVIKLNKTITDNATSALFMMNDQGYCTFMNPAGEKMFGYTFEEIKQKELHYMIHHHHPDGRFYPMETCPIDRALPENFDIRAHEDVFIRKDGSLVQVSCAASPIFENGIPVSTVIEVRDVTQEKAARQEILENMERIHFLLNAMPQKVWTTTAHGKADYFNRNWVEYTGIPYEESLQWGWLKAVHPEDQEQTRLAWNESVRTGEIFQLEYRFLKHNGEYRWHLSRALAYKDAEDRTIMWVGTTTDIHDHKIALENLAKSNTELKKINNDLDNFVYTASHDLKAPVLNIEGLMYALQRELSPEAAESKDVSTIMSMIMQSINRFKGTIENLTEISKIQKSLAEDVEQVPIAEVIEDVVLSISELAKAAGARIKVDTAACEYVRYSRKDLHSILYNLISNAIKYRSPERPPEVEVTSYCNDGEIRISVKDNGLGIKKEQQEKAFVMFKRLHTHVEGSGVGLYIVKKIVENTEGSIVLESEAGKGSVFTVCLKNTEAK